jgi:hypothetical protein
LGGVEQRLVSEPTDAQRALRLAAGNEEADNDEEPSYPCALDEQPGYVVENLLCVVDDGGGRACPDRLRRSFAVGRHVVMVGARDAAGTAGPFAVHRFRVRLVG